MSRHLVAKGLAVFATLVMPAGIGLSLAYQRYDGKTWFLVLGMPLVAGLAGYGLGRARAIQEARRDEEWGEALD